MKLFILEGINCKKEKEWIEIYFKETEAVAALNFYYEKIKHKNIDFYIDYYNKKEFTVNDWCFYLKEVNSGLHPNLLKEINEYGG